MPKRRGSERVREVIYLESDFMNHIESSMHYARQIIDYVNNICTYFVAHTRALADFHDADKDGQIDRAEIRNWGLHNAKLFKNSDECIAKFNMSDFNNYVNDDSILDIRSFPLPEPRVRAAWDIVFVVKVLKEKLGQK